MLAPLGQERENPASSQQHKNQVMFVSIKSGELQPTRD